jgi:uncharacterized alpha-E superfamily protein
MLSRVADSIFWMCRYIERAENIARFINVNWHLMLDSNQAAGQAQWEPLVSVTGDSEYFKAKYKVASRENVIQFLAFDGEYPHSICSCMQAARENARSIREIISTEMWEQVNTFYHMVRDASQRGLPESPYMFFNDVVKESNEFVGLTVTTMMHDASWHFCRAGRMLERAEKTSRILDVKYFYLLPSAYEVGSTIDNMQWAALLRSASGLQAYRLRYGLINPGNVIELLLFNREFPRAVRYCVDRLQDSLHALTGTPFGSFSNEAERACGQLSAQLSYASVPDVLSRGVHEFIDELQSKVNAIGSAISESYFAPRLIEGAVTRPVQSEVQ